MSRKIQKRARKRGGSSRKRAKRTVEEVGSNQEEVGIEWKGEEGWGKRRVNTGVIEI